MISIRPYTVPGRRRSADSTCYYAVNFIATYITRTGRATAVYICNVPAVIPPPRTSPYPSLNFAAFVIYRRTDRLGSRRRRGKHAIYISRLFATRGGARAKAPAAAGASDDVNQVREKYTSAETSSGGWGGENVQRGNAHAASSKPYTAGVFMGLR